jgi:hypothetical protein
LDTLGPQLVLLGTLALTVMTTTPNVSPAQELVLRPLQPLQLLPTLELGERRLLAIPSQALLSIPTLITHLKSLHPQSHLSRELWQLPLLRWLTSQLSFGCKNFKSRKYSI